MPLFRPTDRNLPLAVQFWGEALRSLDPGIADESIWLIAPIPPLSFCSWRCRCEELVAAEFVGLQNLSHLGVSVEELNSESEFPEKVIKTIRRDLRRNGVVVWFDQGSAG